MPQNPIDAAVNDTDRQKLIKNPADREAVDALAYAAKRTPKQPVDNDTMVSTSVRSNDETASLGEEHPFKKLQGELERKGYSDEAAAKIAYHAGVEKYGKEKMAAAARDHEEAKNEGLNNCATFDGFRSSEHLKNWLLTGKR